MTQSESSNIGIQAIIIDDEQYNRDLLRDMVVTYSDRIKIVGSFDNLLNAVDFLQANNVDLVFLDIEMPNSNGLELFEFYSPSDFEVIIVSAYDKYAIPAIKRGVLDYILKPLEIVELKKTLQKVHLLFDDNRRFSTIKLFVNNSIEFVGYNKIVALIAEGSYSRFIFIDGQSLLQSRNLSYFFNKLEGSNFIRVHRSSIINPFHIIGVDRSKAEVELTGDLALRYSKMGKIMMDKYLNDM